MTKLSTKSENVKLLGQTQQEHFTDFYAMDVCACLRTRNLCKAQIGYEGKIGAERTTRSRNKQKLLYKCHSRHSFYTKSDLNSSRFGVDSRTPSQFNCAPAISLALYGNLLQQLVGSLVWYATASTAISILATLYYFIANTQGAMAVLDVTTAISLPATSPLSSLSSSHKSLLPAAKSSSSPSPSSSASHSNFSPTIYTHSSKGYSNSNGSDIKIFLDTWSNNINSTEITILNGVSFAPSNKGSGYSFDNNNNNNNNNKTSGSISNVNISSNYNNVITVSYNNAISVNDTLDDNASEYIFDRTYVRVIFITLYSTVFCCCFFGNLIVILVVALSRRLRSITNFFLANLALADFCVGLFCVMQNLSIYLIDSWVFGDFLCRMYQFVHSLSYTASIFILVVICMERYFAIVHPITCKQILTPARLKMVILTVWIMSAVYSTPKFVFSKTIKNVHNESGREEELCVLDRIMFNSKWFDMVNFGLLYVIPLLVMTILYSKIAIALWRSSRGLQLHLAQQENGMGMHSSMYHHQHHHHLPLNQHHNLSHNDQQQLQEQEQHQSPHLQNHQQQQQQNRNTAAAPQGSLISLNSAVAVGGLSVSRKLSCKYNGKREVNISESQVSLDDDRPVVSTCRKTSFYKHPYNHLTRQQQTPPAASGNHHHHHHHQRSLGMHGSQRVSHISHSSNNILRARRGVIRMLIIFVLTFALCNLPYHARKMWQYWSRSYRGNLNFNALLTPLTFLVTYFNSAINPLLYAFLSRNFRKGMKELLMCSWRKSKTKSSTNSSMHHKRLTMQNHSLPTETTHIGSEQI